MNTVLTDLIPARYRKYLYAALTLAAMVYGVWQAVGGDWHQFIASLIASAIGALATSNTDVTSGLDLPGASTDPDDGLTYEQSGGAPFPNSNTATVDIATDPVADPTRGRPVTSDDIRLPDSLS